MAVLGGKDGAVYISHSSVYGNLTGSSSEGSGDPGVRGFMHKVLSLTNWSLTQPGPELIDATVFGSSWKQDRAGIRDGGSISISGFFNWADSTGQKVLNTIYNGGAEFVYPPRSSQKEAADFCLQSTDHAGYRFELWPSTGTGTTGSKIGLWKFSTAVGSTDIDSRALIITSYNAGQDKSGIGTLDMTMKISRGFFAWTTTLTTTSTGP